MNQNQLKQLPPHYQPMLKESINRFLTEYRKGATNFTDFTSIFSRTLHTTPNPPIPLVWFYTALEFHAYRLGVGKECSRTSIASVDAVKDLFQLLVSCSDGCVSMKRIGVLAPLVFELWRLGVYEKEVKSEIEVLVEGVVSYCSIYCLKSEVEVRGGDGVVVLEEGFVDLIPVWMIGCDGEFGVGGGLKEFFPFVSDQIRKGIEMGCEVGYLAGVVMFEALLLKMCLIFDAGITRGEKEKKLQASAAQIMTGFRNFYFLDTLFRMMLEPVLPVISLLGSENEVLLKEVLYNSVVMMDYSFINRQPGVSLYANGLKDFAINWLFVAELAIQSARENGDHGKTTSYILAFCRSCIPIQLINWVISQSGIDRKIGRPSVSTPIDLIKWLLVVEEQGSAIFGCGIAKHRAKAFLFTSRAERIHPVVKHPFLNLIHGGSVIDRVGGGDVEMHDTVDAMSLSGDDKMNTTTIDGTRKRKEGIEDDTKAQLKYMRCQFHENSGKENSFIFRQQ
ncbi:unnamed protein product [Lathyrus oleraceus]|uniref:Uncharacterized protein n=1 Tax=Pisum sativum TaxID=3888 RepID=A0A9D4W1M8_PEA|nr:uncharacterized protein LOC127091175 [Pisum sativum]KAI5393462.1 hypothetical protein KIW84_060555 [Pisum sativum]